MGEIATVARKIAGILRQDLDQRRDFNSILQSFNGRCGDTGDGG